MAMVAGGGCGMTRETFLALGLTALVVALIIASPFVSQWLSESGKVEENVDDTEWDTFTITTDKIEWTNAIGTAGINLFSVDLTPVYSLLTDAGIRIELPAGTTEQEAYAFLRYQRTLAILRAIEHEYAITVFETGRGEMN